MLSRYDRSQKIGHAFKNAVARMPVGRRRKKLMSRVGNRNLAIGLSAGIAAGIATGMLLAPDKGKKIRKDLAKRTNSFFGDVKSTGKQLGKKSSRLWMAGKGSAEGAREAIIESAERH